MTNRVQKEIIYHLARANTYAAREIVKSLEKQEDKEEARRIFAAVGIKLENENYKKGEQKTMKTKNGKITLDVIYNTIDGAPAKNEFHSCFEIIYHDKKTGKKYSPAIFTDFEEAFVFYMEMGEPSSYAESDEVFYYTPHGDKVNITPILYILDDIAISPKYMRQ